MSRLASVTSRLVLAMTLVAAVAVGASGLLAAPLLRGVAEDAAREPLGRQADLLARLPAPELLLQRVTRRTGVRDLSLGVITPAGRVRDAAGALTPGERRRLLAGEAVSSTGTLDGTAVVLEGRPTARGGAVVLAASVESVDESASALRRRLLLALALGLVLAVAVAYVVGRRVSRPLARTADAARRMARGERGVELPPADSREADDLVRALTGLDRALTASEARQRDFLLSVSHELRTPLTAVRGLAEGLADGTVPPEDAREVGRTVLGEAERLERYVVDLLALARLEADDFTVHREPTDLVALVVGAAAAWQDRATRAGVSVVAGSGSPVVVATDAGRVRQALDALLDNAVRVCPPGSTVWLRAAPGGTGAVVEVRDDGPGLTADDLGHTFEAGVLHDRYAGRRPGGHGLGLALVKRLVERLDGTVTAAAAEEGGVLFTITLPHGAGPVGAAG